MLTEQDSVSLVKSLFQDSDFSYFRKKIEDIKKLVRKFENLPLALLHAAACIREKILYEDSEYSIGDYLKVYNKQFNKAFPAEYEYHYKNTVYTALKENIEKSIVNEHARRVFSCMAYMNPYDIRDDLFLSLSNITKENLAEAYRELSKYSIMTREKKHILHPNPMKYLKVHTLLLEIHRICIKEENNEENILLTLFELLMKTNKAISQSHLQFILPRMSERLLTEGYKRIFSSGLLLHYITEDLQRIDCDISATKHWRALHYAEYSCHADIISELETRVESSDNFAVKWSPLHAAMLNGKNNVNMLHLTKKYNNMLNLQTDSGLTALHIAAATGCKGNVQSLLDCRCEASIADNAGNTAAHWAMRNGCYNIVLKLINKGINVNLVNNELNTLLHIITVHCNQQCEGEHNSRADNITLHNVLEEDQDLLLHNLIAAGADVNLLNKQGHSPIHLAKMNNQQFILIILLNSKKNGNRTLDEIIFEHCSFSEITEYDINNQKCSSMIVQINSKTNESFAINKLVQMEDGIKLLQTISPDMMFTGNLEMKKFIETFYNIPLALHLAVNHCKHEIKSIAELLDYIMHSPNTKEYDKFMNSCSLPNYTNVIKLICLVIRTVQEYDPQVFEFLCFVAYLPPGFQSIGTLYQLYKVGQNNVNCLCEILVRLSLLEAYDESAIKMHSLVSSIARLFVQKPEIPLIFQTIYNTNNVESIRFILKYMDIDDIANFYKNVSNKYYRDGTLMRLRRYGLKYIDIDKWSVLHHAVADLNDGAWEIVNRLISLDVNVNTAVDGLTALHLATVSLRQDNIGNLIRAGAHVNAMTKEGHTPLHLAIMTNCWKRKQALENAGAYVNLINLEGETFVEFASLTQNIICNC